MSKDQKQKTVAFQRGTEAGSSSKRNKWWVEWTTVYSGFELELAGVERYAHGVLSSRLAINGSQVVERLGLAVASLEFGRTL